MLQPRLAHIRDRELQNRLLEQGLLEARQIQDVLARQYKHYQASHDDLRGQLYQVSLRQHHLQIKQSIELSLLNQIELSPQGPASQQEWGFWGRQILLLDPETPRQLDAMSWLPGDAIGLTLSQSLSYLYTPDLGGQPWLVQTRSLIDPHIAETQAVAGPYDIFCDAGHRLVCVVDRAPGDLWLVDTSDYQVHEIFTLRHQPGSQALLLEPDPGRGRIYFVDQERPCLNLLDYGEGVLEEYPFDGLVPVNLALHHNRLLLLIQQPKPMVLCLDADSLSERWRVELPEALWIEHHACAATPMALSPDGRMLAILCAEPGQAKLLWLDTHSHELREPQILTGRPHPSLMAFALPNPLQRHRRRLAQLLLEDGLVSEDALLNLFPSPADEGSEIEIIAPETQQPADATLAIGELAQAPPPPQPELKAPPPGDAALLFLSPIERFTSLPDPHPAENYPLPDEAVEDILHVLSGSFFQHTGIDLEAHPEALALLRRHAEGYRVQLQDYDVIPVDIPDLMAGTRLKTLLLRESILTLSELRRNPERYPFDTPPSHCPECKSPLLGHWDCETCGLELLTPERAQKRRIASVTQHTWLPPGYFALPDVQSGRLLLVNTHRYNYITWQIDFRYLPGARQPWDMLWLEHLHVLLTDRGAGRVLECSHSGRIVWELDTQASPELGLEQPVKSTVWHLNGEPRYLVVDQGQHRIIEVDRRQRITWHFGHRGIAGAGQQFLNTPNDVQYTHEDSYLITDTGNDRVLEVRSNRVIRVFGAEIKLKRPVFAERLFNGNTLIVDAGHRRLLELDEDGRLKREVIYFREGMDERFDMAYPLKMVRRENQNVVLIDANRVMEIDPLSKQIVWFSFLHELKLDIELPARLRQTEIKMPTAQNYESYRIVDMPKSDDMPTLRRTLRKLELFAEQGPGFFDELEAKLHFRRYKAGDVILRKGQLGHSFFVLQSGRVEVLAGSSDEPSLLLEPGDSFGFMGIIYREPRKNTMRALDECGVYVLEKKDFDALLPQYPEIEKAVQKLAAERLVVARLKTTPKSQQAASRLESLIASHRERAQDRLARQSQPTVTRPESHTPHRLSYNEIEQHVIAAAANEGVNCLELHIVLRRSARMKAARVALIVSMLDRAGSIIRTEPTPDLIMQDAIEQEVILTLLSAADPGQIREDISAVSDVESVAILHIEL